jgi:hypothetical protein
MGHLCKAISKKKCTHLLAEAGLAEIRCAPMDIFFLGNRLTLWI